MTPLQQLNKYGQSYWMDNLTRDLIRSGGLAARITSQGLRGVTSNPAIFHKAITSSADYDEQIAELVRERHSVDEIYEQLVVTDVRDACDVLRPVYDASDGVDGLVSLEVAPTLAYDTAATIDDARRLWNAVDRPNACIKIPGTPPGLAAIEQTLFEGININITLLFSIADYEAVAQTYITALERRAAEGQSIRRIASVASFFLSRIDVLVDQLLSHRIRPEGTVGYDPRPAALAGRVANANAKLAYQSYKTIFSGTRWQALLDQGAHVQRPLWASTGTKNPDYSDVMYVDPLIGPDTVNTMPEETSSAFADHGALVENAVESGLEEARQVLKELEAVGIDLDNVTWQLQHEGVQKFIEPFNALMQALAQKC